MGDGRQQLPSGRHQADDLDFHAFGLSGQPLCPEGRVALITVDFEAFDAFSAPMWSHAMRCWADACGPAAIPTCFFVALEDVAKLRAAAPRRYRDFTDAIRALAAAGCAFYPHNHGVFDPETGDVPARSIGRPQHVRGSRKRASFFFDVVRLNERDLADWMRVLSAEHHRLMTDCGLSGPVKRVFRPGGWDNSSTPDEIRRYIRALREAAYEYDSSAAAGDFGTAGWRVGAPFGRNTFRLGPGLIEVAPTAVVNSAAPPWSRGSLASWGRTLGQPKLVLRSRPGVSVMVLHFDHLLSRRGMPYDAAFIPAACGR